MMNPITLPFRRADLLELTERAIAVQRALISGKVPGIPPEMLQAELEVLEDYRKVWAEDRRDVVPVCMAPAERSDVEVTNTNFGAGPLC